MFARLEEQEAEVVLPEVAGVFGPWADHHEARIITWQWLCLSALALLDCGFSIWILSGLAFGNGTVSLESLWWEQWEVEGCLIAHSAVCTVRSLEH